MQDHKRLITAGYNAISRPYLAEREKLKTSKYVNLLIDLLPRDATILDVGCGAGVPVDNELLKKGFLVTGVDISEEQIKLARKMCKGGDYRVADIDLLKTHEYSVNAVVCLFTMFHLPRAKHKEMISIFASYLPIGGYLLISMGDTEFEGEHAMFGTPMWSSQWGCQKNSQIIKNAGFEIITDELNTTGSEKHQIILAVKK